MAYRMKSSGLPFKELGSSPAKQDKLTSKRPLTKEEKEENKKPLSIGINENSFELVLRILGNEFIAIRIGSTNFSGKLIAGSILLLFFTFMLLEVFGLSRMLGIE